MIDGSALKLEENIALARKVVEFAHPKGVCVEGELGKIKKVVKERIRVCGSSGRM